MQVANLCNLQVFANIFVCTVLTDLLTLFLKIDIHVRFTIIHFRKSRFKKNIGSCKFMQLANFLGNKFVCTILLKIDIHVRFTMTHVSNSRFFQNYYW